MSEYKALPVEISAAVDRLARRRAKKGSDSGEVYARLAVLSELTDQIRLAEREVVDELRKSPRENTWDIIASNMGISLNSLWLRHAQKGERKTGSSAVELPGISVTEAEQAANAYRTSIYKCAEDNPDDTWFVRVETSGLRGSQLRVVDVEGLKKALIGSSTGMTVVRAARSLGVTPVAIRDLMKTDPDATWFEKVERSGTRAITLVFDVQALGRALARRK